MGLPTTPPQRRDPSENHATLLISWWATGCALFIILLRVFGRLSRTGTLFTEDIFMACAILPLLIRMGLVHVVLVYGTNNTTLDGLTEMGIQDRMMGSKYVLAARIFYAMFIWVSKLTVSEFLKRLTTSTWNRTYEVVMQGVRYFLLATFFAVVIATLSECQPFHHYWQVVPDPGPSCRNGFAQLFTMGICDITTDIVLVAFPIVVLMRSTMPLSRKLITISLYSLGAILIAIAAYRIPAIVAVHGRQQRRSLWASIEILASAAAANAVIIGSFVRDRGMKKVRRRRTDIIRTTTRSDTEGPSINQHSARRHWGQDSDEDLFRSIGGRMNSVAPNEEMSPQQPDILTALKSSYQEPYEDIEEEYEQNGSANGSAGRHASGRHASESLALQDPGGLLGHTRRDFAAEQTTAGAQEPRPEMRTARTYDELDIEDPGGLLR